MKGRKKQLIFDGEWADKSALRLALETVRAWGHAYEMQIQFRGPRLTIWTRKISAPRAESKHRWGKASKDRPAPLGGTRGTIEDVIRALLDDTLDLGDLHE